MKSLQQIAGACQVLLLNLEIQIKNDHFSGSYFKRVCVKKFREKSLGGPPTYMHLYLD